MKSKRVEINLGFLCNNRCKFCITNVPFGQRRFSRLQVLKKELKSYYKKGYRALGFLGGEPTIYPGITELVSYARKLGYNEIHIVSNGRRYSDKKFLEGLIKSGATKFYVSIHSHKANLEDYLTSVKGSFKEKIKGLSNLKGFFDKGLIKNSILLNTVINKVNYKYLDKIIRFYHKRGFSDFRFDFIRPVGSALRNADTMVPRYSRVMEYVKKSLGVAQSLGVNLTFGAIPLCLFWRYNIKVPRHCIGDFTDTGTESSLGENNTIKRFVISQTRKGRYKVKRKACKDCVFNCACEGIWKEYVKLYGFREIRPVISLKKELYSP